MSDSLLPVLRKLRLSGLSTSLEVRLHEAASCGLTHREFLELVLQDELNIRNDRQITRRITSAGFREAKKLEDFDFSFNTTIKKNRIYDLATCHYIREHRDVLWPVLSDRKEPSGTVTWSGCHSLWIHSLLSFDLRHRSRLPARRSHGGT